MRALLSVSCVVKVFEQTTNSVVRRVDLLEHFGELRAVDVGDAVQADRAIPISTQRLRGHDDAEVGAADPDVDDVGVAGAAVAGDPAFVYPGDELAHPCRARPSPPA